MTPQDRLGKIVIRDELLLKKHTLLELLCLRRGHSNLTDLQNLAHPAKNLVRHLGKTGSPVLLSTSPWTPQRKDAAMQRGPHKSAQEYIDFLWDELVDMVDKATWLVLPYH